MHALSYITEKYKQLEGLLVNKYGAGNQSWNVREIAQRASS